MRRTLAALCLFISLPAVARGEFHQQVDQLLGTSRLGESSAICTDAEFIRRVYLDFWGRIPSVVEARAFLSDKAENKRAALVDRLLASEHFARHMSQTLDVMIMERRAEKYIKTPAWRQYLFESIRDDKPYNIIAAEVLEADGSDDKTRMRARFFLDREGEPNLMARDTGRIFFGMDLQCAQCHDHPLVDDYYQTDYFGLFSFFNRSYIFTNKKKVAFAADRPDGDVEFKSVFTDETNLFSPQVPGELPVADPLVKPGDEYSVKPAADVRPVPKYSRRLELAKLVRQGGIPAFDRNIVNRLWAQLMGRGLVHPVDLHHTSNPPVQPELLDMLAKQFRDSKYDLKTFYRELALSQTYQRAFEFPEKMAADAEMAAQLAALQAAKAEKDKAVAALDEQFTTNRDALLKQRVTMLPVRAERDKAKSALATVNKAVAAATKAATDAKAKFDAKNAVAAAVADALQKSTEAAKKAPEDKVLAEAVAKISGRSTAFNKEAAPLKAAWEAADAKAKKAAEPVAAAAAKVTEQFTKLADLEKAALPLHQKYEDVVERRRLEALAANHLAERITNLQQLIDYRKLDQQSSATNAQLAAADKELAAAQAAVAALEPVAAENAEKLADAKASQAKLTPLAAELRKSATALLEQRDKAYDDLSQKLSDRFVTATLKPLNPEQLAWSLLQVGGLIERQRAASAAEINKKTPLDENAQKDPAKVAAREREIDAAAHVKLLGNVAPIVKLFGASAGQPQDEFFATVDQALFFSNGGQVRGWLNPSGDNLTARLGKLEDPSKVAEELYLGVLTRFPTKEEVADVTAYLSTEGLPKPAAVREMTWALVTSAEFRFNH